MRKVPDQQHAEGYSMMPLTLANAGEENTILKVGGNVIVKVKEARVAISEEMARKIMV